MIKALAFAGTAIGVITGLGTIVGWLVSDETPLEVARFAVGSAGMLTIGAFGLLCLGIALMPPRRLRRFLTQSEGSEGLPPLLRRPLVGRLAYLALAFGVVLMAEDSGLDPRAGYWVALGVVFLAIGVGAVIAVRRQVAEARRRELRECPDCAELVKAKARVCRYCGYRFAPPPETVSDEALADQVKA